MDVSAVVADAFTATAATAQALGFDKLLILRRSSNSVSVSDSSSSSDQSPGTSIAPLLQISALIFPVDAVAPPPVKPNTYRTLTRALLRRSRRRTKRRSRTGDGSDEGEGGAFYGDDIDGGNGPFGGGFGFYGGGGGPGWNFDGFGGQSWDDSSRSFWGSGFAFDFVYEVIYWIALSNCMHFAFKRMGRIVGDGIGDGPRGKVPVRLTEVC